MATLVSACLPGFPCRYDSRRTGTAQGRVEGTGDAAALKTAGFEVRGEDEL